MTGGAIVVGGGSNHGFARKLASSDKSTREKAVALLVLWLSCQHEIGEDELKQIWKGLFYCVWHTDKAPVQAELIERLAGILEILNVELSLSFFKVFLSTMRREWGSIDRLRLDKFYLLLRKFLFHMFKVLEKGGWDKELITRFMEALEERAFLAKDRFPALGVSLHLTDIFWDEFHKFAPVPDGTFGLLLEPFYSTLSASSDKTLLRRVRENVFNPLLVDARVLLSSDERKQSPGGTAWSVEYLLHSTKVAPRLFDLASSPATAQANRKVLYELNDEFSKLGNSLKSVSGIAVHLNVNKECLLLEQDGNTVAGDPDENIRKQSEDADGGSRTRSRKRQARAAAALGVKLSVQDIGHCKVKKPKTARMEQSSNNVSIREDGEKEPVGNGELLDLLEDGKEERRGQAMISKRKRSFNASVVTAKTEIVLQTKSAKREEKTLEKVQRKLVRVGIADTEADSSHELDVDRSDRELGTNGHQSTSAQVSAVESNWPNVGHEDILEVSMNLEKKFDFEAAEEMIKSFSNCGGMSGNSLASSRESCSPKKMKKEKATTQSSGFPSSTGGGPAASPTLQPPAKADVDEQLPRDSLKKPKKVRFALRNNLVCKPHGPLPPLSVRTPPSATPRGSALKSGVLPGPIRTRPIRVARGTGLLKSRKRASRQFLTMSLQKTKSSKRKLRNRQSL